MGHNISRVRKPKTLKRVTSSELIDALQGIHDATYDLTYLDRKRGCSICRLLYRVDMQVLGVRR